MSPGRRPSPHLPPQDPCTFTSPRPWPDRTGGAAGGTLRPGPAALTPARCPSPLAWTLRGASPRACSRRSLGPATPLASGPARPDPPLRAREGHVYVTHNQRGLQRGPDPGRQLRLLRRQEASLEGLGKGKRRTKQVFFLPKEKERREEPSEESASLRDRTVPTVSQGGI